MSHLKSCNQFKTLHEDSPIAILELGPTLYYNICVISIESKLHFKMQLHPFKAHYNLKQIDMELLFRFLNNNPFMYNESDVFLCLCPFV